MCQVLRLQIHISTFVDRHWSYEFCGYRFISQSSFIHTHHKSLKVTGSYLNLVLNTLIIRVLRLQPHISTLFFTHWSYEFQLIYSLFKKNTYFITSCNITFQSFYSWKCCLNSVYYFSAWHYDLYINLIIYIIHHCGVLVRHFQYALKSYKNHAQSHQSSHSVVLISLTESKP